jgi:poly(3-hydroxybutyrate) depolymerase
MVARTIGYAPRVHRALSILLLLVAIPAVLVAAPVPGWKSISIPETGSYAERYIPASLDPTRPAPVIVFLHGYGSKPYPYRDLIAPGAEATGAVLVVPSAQGKGWGDAEDEVTIAKALERVGQEVALDPLRRSLAGHSAGGAYAYLLAYLTEEHWSAVFTLAASYYPVAAVADPRYTAPIRMYYGTADPNYAAAYPNLVAQWQGLGVPFESDVAAGYAHCCWPESALVDGFRFLVAAEYPGCRGDATRLCLGGNRFEVRLDWRSADGQSGPGHVAPASTSDAGLFWFFAEDNWEMLVKVLDGCALNGKRWVFAAATTNVGFTLTVTDTATGAVWQRENPAGHAAAPVQDTAAFSCP